jgi:hypothetical protein
LAMSDSAVVITKTTTSPVVLQVRQSLPGRASC